MFIAKGSKIKVFKFFPTITSYTSNDKTFFILNFFLQNFEKTWKTSFLWLKK